MTLPRLLYPVPLLLLLAGCRAHPGLNTDSLGTAHWWNAAKSGPADSYAWLTLLGAGCIALAVCTLIASTFVPFIPRKAAWMAVACGIGCIVLKAFFVKLLGPLLWVSIVLGVIGGLAVLYPWAVGWVNANLLKRSRQLEREGDSRAATALRVAAMPGKYRSKGARKALLARVSGTVQPQPSRGGGHAGVFP